MLRCEAPVPVSASREGVWTRPGSNRRPQPCKGRVIPLDHGSSFVVVRFFWIETYFNVLFLVFGFFGFKAGGFYK